VYNRYMALSKKQERAIDEYLIDFNGQKAGERAGYSKQYARQAVYKILQKPEAKERIAERMRASQASAEEVISRFSAMARGDLPTKVVSGSNAREEFDYIGATERLAKVFALFIDKQEIEYIGLEIIDDDLEE